MIECFEKQINLAIIGCGAVTEELYLPAAQLLPDLSVTHIVDLNMERAQSVAQRFEIPHCVTDYRDVFGKVEGVIVATPPNSHASISIDCLNHQLPTLCEKPLTTSVEEAQDIIAADQRSQAHLAVGMVRRLSWSSQLLKRLMQAGILGKIHRFDIEGGEEYDWPLRAGHTFQDSNTGGVLADFGPHVLDLLLWCLNSQKVQLSSYKDDNWGGVEANAILELAVEHVSGQVPGRIELSFTRTLRNTLRIYGENGFLEAPYLGGYEVLFYPNDEDTDPVTLKLPEAKYRKPPEEFAVQLSIFAHSIIGNSKKYVTPDEVLMTISLVEQCYRSRESIAQSWEIKHLEPFFESERNGS